MTMGIAVREIARPDSSAVETLAKHGVATVHEAQGQYRSAAFEHAPDLSRLGHRRPRGHGARPSRATTG